MCGVAGFLSADGRTHEDELRAAAARMGDALAHRGPDGGGSWVEASDGGAVAFAHRRLAVLDLTPAGAQPMRSADGRWVLSYNGEVYNFRALRAELEAAGRAFSGGSDTEAVLAAIAEWGVEAALPRLDGMFAFAAWDRRERTLHLVRDRLGVKPMYYGWADGGTFLFGSELRALRAHPAFRPAVDREALTLYLRRGHVPAPYSIHEGVRQLRPGSLLSVRPGQRPGDASPRAWWSLASAIARGAARRREGADALASLERLRALLDEAVTARTVADVPLGVLFSGGVDSSLVAALMAARAARPIRTFTVGFEDAAFDEAPAAAAVARRLGAEHAELAVTGADARAVVPRLAGRWDEPFADPSQIPTWLIAEFARGEVTVALSGDGGDELFAGYPHYALARRAWAALGWAPRPARRGLARALRLAPGRSRAGRRLRTLAGAIAEPDGPSFHRALTSHWKRPAEALALPAEPPAEPPPRGLPDGLGAWMLYADTAGGLPDRMLTKIDRASMGVGLEVRVPLLDHRVVEYVWGLPMRLRERRGKWMLRRVLREYVPPALTDRPKSGFTPPLDGWLRGPLREWAEELLDEARLRREGYFRPEPILARWREQTSGARDWRHPLWSVLMFQAWLEAWG